MATQKERALLRALLKELLAEREDAQTLYIPRGEAGMRRMIDALLAMRMDVPNARLSALMQEWADAQRTQDE